MMADEALEIVQKILEPKRLNYAQELVFLQSWSGKIYREIASESGYDLDYIKEVGSQLWSSLSNALNEKVTKKNFKLVLSNLYGTQIDPVQQEPFSHLDSLEFPGGSVPVYSNLYIDRPPIEERVNLAITRPGCLVRLKAPTKMGKTSLVYRTLAQAKQRSFYTALINFQRADSALLSDLNRFLRWFCLNITRQLNLDVRLDDYWDDEAGSKISCTFYFEEHLLNQLNRPVVLALDEVNRIFSYPGLVREFLPLLRSWHEEAATSEAWQKLRLIVIHSTDIYVPLSINQSPFNVGLPLQLPEFTLAQIQELSQRCGLHETNLNAQELEALMNLVGGHPYLVRLAFYWLCQQELTLPQLLQEAPTQSGIYGHHLRRHWEMLQQHPELWEALQQVIAADEGGVQLETLTAYRLESMGLIKLRGNRATTSCALYRLFFSSQMMGNELDNDVREHFP